MQHLPVLKYSSRKLLKLLSLLIAVAIFSFVMLALSPIDPVDAYIGADMMLVSPEQRELIAERWGLNDPPVERFLAWGEQVLQGNLGTSLIYNRPVIEVIGTRFIASLWLMLTAWMLSGILGFTLGVLAGAYPDSLLDRAIRFYAYTLASSPAFWVGMLLLVIFSVSLRLTPICCGAPPGVDPADVTFIQRLHHIILPALTLSIVGIPGIALHTRQELIEVLNSDYVLFARAQGESTIGAVWQHGIRNIALPAITLQFASLSELFGGAVLAEQVFTYSGLGEATVQAGLRGDVPLLLGIVLFSAVFVFVGNTIADLLYKVVDPRIKIGE